MANLITNAVKHTTQGTIQVTLMVIEQDQIPYLRLIVSDEGEGIPTSELESIFQPLRTRADKTVGGVGLAVVREVIEAHGGNVIAYNNPTKGASFQVLLPLIEEVVRADE